MYVPAPRSPSAETVSTESTVAPKRRRRNVLLRAMAVSNYDALKFCCDKLSICESIRGPTCIQRFMPGYTGWAKKMNPKCSTHNFVKYWPILKKFFNRYNPQKIWMATVMKYPTTPQTRRYTTLWMFMSENSLLISWIANWRHACAAWAWPSGSEVNVCKQTSPEHGGSTLRSIWMQQRRL